ncbi:MAG: hypothetical protein GWN00_01500 [Aliifodinibius sp.]|nr:hypothetical protein [Phycisphaerae bacterium]NIR62355.1 hypothetical protein [candidate division Zixibacteria bacterium]NIT54954.1 hypothetical protein [Fodinibius sp.]NIW43366.1 hypothetical protein [Gammaproteobacteria bacterium]NIU12588.1 hypothetical protein [candidate division Zixibacteria bacterium]
MRRYYVAEVITRNGKEGFPARVSEYYPKKKTADAMKKKHRKGNTDPNTSYVVRWEEADA